MKTSDIIFLVSVLFAVSAYVYLFHFSHRTLLFDYVLFFLFLVDLTLAVFLFIIKIFERIGVTGKETEMQEFREE